MFYKKYFENSDMYMELYHQFPKIVTFANFIPVIQIQYKSLQRPCEAPV